MSVQPLAPRTDLNWSMIGFLFAAAVTIAGWIAFGAQAAQRIDVLEQRTQPLANGDLVKVERDVAWIRERLEQDAGR